MRVFFSGVTLIGCIIGGLLLLAGMMSDSAPRMAAFAATGVGFAVIPYIITRLQYMSHIEDVSKVRHDALVKAMQNQPRDSA